MAVVSLCWHFICLYVQVTEFIQPFMQAELVGMDSEGVGSTSLGDVFGMEDEDLYLFP